MHHIIKSFFYAVALLTLYWITQTPVADITFAAWATAVQSLEAQQCAAILATAIEFSEMVMGGILYAPSVATRAVGAFRQGPKFGQ